MKIEKLKIKNTPARDMLKLAGHFSFFIFHF